MKAISRGVPLLAAVLTTMLLPNVAQASSDRITQGEAQAVYHAAPSGGSAILFSGNGLNVGAPANSEVAIRPYFDNGIHYCVQDWHVIAINAFDVDVTLQQATADFSSLVLTFKLDGTVLPTERTAVKAVANTTYFGADKVYYMVQGRVMSPSDLTVGSHTLVLTVYDPENASDNSTLKTKFYVDAAGSGACL